MNAIGVLVEWLRVGRRQHAFAVGAERSACGLPRERGVAIGAKKSTGIITPEMEAKLGMHSARHCYLCEASLRKQLRTVGGSRL